MKAVALRYLISKRRVTKQLKTMVNSAAPLKTYSRLDVLRSDNTAVLPSHGT
jgi:hypothetical protein